MIPAKNGGPAYSLFSDEMAKLFEMDYASIDVKEELSRIAALLDEEIAK
jgi:hypothetical protein